jgi:hypothetical protein
MAKENPSWGYDRIVGAMANLGHKLSDQTVGNILRRHDIPPAPLRKHTTSWEDFIRAHLDVLAGTDFFTVEVVTLKGLITYYVLFFIHLESRKVSLARMTPYSNPLGGKGGIWVDSRSSRLSFFFASFFFLWCAVDNVEIPAWWGVTLGPVTN